MFRNRSERASIKKGCDADESRRKRADVTVELRKKQRDEQVMKRRMKQSSTAADAANDSENVNNLNSLQTADKKLTAADIQDRLKNLPALVTKLQSDNVPAALEAVTEFRRLLSIEKNPPIQQVIDSGIVPRLVQMLSFTQHENVQFEAAWTLTNIASGTSQHTQHIMDHGAVQMFIFLLGSPSADVREQAVWALGNIAGDSPKFRDTVLGHNVVQPLLNVFNAEAKLSMIRNATWTLSNLCRGKPQPQFEMVQPILPTLARLVQMDDVEILTDACWALSYLSDDNGATNSKIQAVIDAGVAPRVVKCLMHHHTSVQVPALRCIGNIVTGDDKQTELILQQKPLGSLLGLLNHRKKNIRKESCWTISNITAGSAEQIQTVIDANLIQPLVSLLRDAEFDIQKEAAWAISNATSGGNSKQIEFLVSQGGIPALCELFNCSDAKIIMVALEGIENILRVGQKIAAKSGANNTFSDFVEECGGLDHLENLQQHENEDIYEKSVKLLKDYFDSEEEEQETVAPVVNGNQFSFGLAPTTSVVPTGGFVF